MKSGQNSCSCFEQGFTSGASPVCGCADNASVVQGACACDTGLTFVKGVDGSTGGTCALSASGKAGRQRRYAELASQKSDRRTSEELFKLGAKRRASVPSWA